ncbi:MAG TPA: maleylpyruvate isomerase family mycothiol-dependent enzyme [Micromonosporaceae bacterium]|nr:maleylpyruvate isomerase family mycothiol-dependent enzyme [Micromonosporaceae bacterium]
MTTDPLVLLPEVDRATARLLGTAGSLDDAGVAAPSLVPSWTRGHVLAHLARQADSVANVLAGARSGVATAPYASEEARAAGIEADADRPIADHLEDLRVSAERLAAACAAMPPEAWTATVPGRGGTRLRAAGTVWSRLREIEVHHVDLAAGYTPADWPEAFTARLLLEVQADFAAGPAIRLEATDLGRMIVLGPPAEAAPTVSGAGSTLAAWLVGRADGAGLAVSPPGPLPHLPPWK